jgi:sulfatase maturation enzyme AslB (radical SAM superfamily)
MKNKNTYCYFLWEEAFINDKGNVYSCCHQKPGILGNIYNNTLKEILKLPKIQKLRQLSIQGKLKCHKNCTLLGEHKSEDLPKENKFKYENVTGLKILFGEGCNINCVMCWQNSNKKRELDPEILIKNIDLSSIAQIDLQGGEPLYLKSARKYFDHCIEQNKQVSFLTNGTIMNEKWAEKIAQHSRAISVSLNAATKETHEKVNIGSSWKTVLENIQLLQKAKEKINSKMEIAGHITIITANLREIPLFIDKYKEFGFDRIKFGFDLRIPIYLKFHPIIKKRLAEKITASLKLQRNNKAINVERLKYLRLVDDL